MDESTSQRLQSHYAAAAGRARKPSASATADSRGPYGAVVYDADDVIDVPESAVAGSLACGNPVAVADIRSGDHVLDLGSGAGLDLILTARRVGRAGKVYGLDITEEMLLLARDNLRVAGVTNAELLKGTIEDIPLPAATVDVVISNCVINLSTDKARVLAETARVLRRGGRLGISDLVARPGTPVEACTIRSDDGSKLGEAITADLYRQMLQDVGLANVSIDLHEEVAPSIHAAIIRASRSTDGPPVLIEDLRPCDWDDVHRIFEEGLATGDASAELRAPTWTEWDTKYHPHGRLVARSNGNVVGWAALRPTSPPCVAGGTAEASVYVAASARGRGVGRQLLAALNVKAEHLGFWTLEAGIFPENTASLALHHRCGFRTVGIRERLVHHNDRWRDVVLLELRAHDTVR